MANALHRGAKTRATFRRLLSVEALEDRLAPAVLGDFVWADANANGLQDSGETGVSGVTVRLLGNGQNLSTVTDAGGKFAFNTAALAAGYYYLQLGSVPVAFIAHAIAPIVISTIPAMMGLRRWSVCVDAAVMAGLPCSFPHGRSDHTVRC